MAVLEREKHSYGNGLGSGDCHVPCKRGDEAERRMGQLALLLPLATNRDLRRVEGDNAVPILPRRSLQSTH